MSCIRTLPARAIGAALACVFASAALQAEEITLRMKGGQFKVSGELESFDKETYAIRSQRFGTMKLKASRFDCIGDNCPTEPFDRAKERLDKAFGPKNPAGKIEIAGSNAIGNQLMPNLIQAYAKSVGVNITKVAHEDPLNLTFKITGSDGADLGVVDLHRHGSLSAFAALQAKTSQIGMASRPIRSKERQDLKAAGLGKMRSADNEHIVALDGLVVLVSPQSPVVSLSIENLAKIFSGKIKNWSELGHPAGPIQIYTPAEKSGTWDTFNGMILKPRGLKVAETSKHSKDHAELSDWIAADANSIGITSMAYQRNAKAVNVESSCGLIAPPTPFSMKTEEYPLSRRLYLYSPGSPENSLARGILEFAMSDAAQSVIAQSDFMNHVPESLSFDAQNVRFAHALNAVKDDANLPLLKKLMGELKEAKRLSVTFRFSEGNTTLDNKSKRDVVRLRDQLATDAYQGKTVSLIGFADSVGEFDVNLNLSAQRAQAVLDALRLQQPEKLSRVTLTSLGFGELAPVTCNDTPRTQAINRRVEVWVK